MDSTTVLKETKKQLHKSDFKLTPQWEAIVLVLLENGRNHLLAEEVYFLVEQKSPRIGLVTVYQTLEILTDLKVVGKVSFNDGLAHRDLRKEGVKCFRHHPLCLECGTIEEMEEGSLDEVGQTVGSQYHFLIKDHRLAFHGTYQSYQGRH